MPDYPGGPPTGDEPPRITFGCAYLLEGVDGPVSFGPTKVEHADGTVEFVPQVKK